MQKNLIQKLLNGQEIWPTPVVRRWSMIFVPQVIIQPLLTVSILEKSFIFFSFLSSFQNSYFFFKNKLNYHLFWINVLWPLLIELTTLLCPECTSYRVYFLSYIIAFTCLSERSLYCEFSESRDYLSHFLVRHQVQCLADIEHPINIYQFLHRSMLMTRDYCYFFNSIFICDLNIMLLGDR